MKICYIAHQVGGEVSENLAHVRRIIREINIEYPDVVPFCPWYSDVVSLCDDVQQERERGLKNCHRVLTSGVVDELWLYGPRISKGMAGEIEMAKEMGIKIVPKSKEIIELYK